VSLEKQGGPILKENPGKVLLLFAGWLSVIFAFLQSSMLLGVIAICIGLVLRKDYDKRKQGLWIMILGIIGALSGPLLGWLFIMTLQ
jgi:hypothetical protein